MTRLPQSEPEAIAARFLADLDALPAPSTASIRVLRRQYSQQLRSQSARFVWDVVQALQPELRRGTPRRAGLRWVACELVASHRAAFQALDAARLEQLAGDMQSWDEVDAFARILAGPAWLQGLISDATVHAWARSPDLWWRRAAAVCTVALNMRSQGGTGDPRRTLAVCEILAADREAMVQKAVSWALRELVPHDAAAVAVFLDAHATGLAPQTRREVRHKLATGLKAPRRKPMVRT